MSEIVKEGEYTYCKNFFTHEELKDALRIEMCKSLERLAGKGMEDVGLTAYIVAFSNVMNMVDTIYGKGN